MLNCSEPGVKRSKGATGQSVTRSMYLNTKVRFFYIWFLSLICFILMNQYSDMDKIDNITLI